MNNAELRGYAQSLYNQAPEGRKSVEAVLPWMVRCITFLLQMYINKK